MSELAIEKASGRKETRTKKPKPEKERSGEKRMSEREKKDYYRFFTSGVGILESILFARHLIKSLQ